MLKRTEAKLFKPSTWALFRSKSTPRINQALSIPLILDNIYKHLDHSDKKSFRAVNKTIWKHFVEKFKAGSWIHIDSKLRFIKLYKSFLKVETEGKTDIQQNIKDHVFPHVIFFGGVRLLILNKYSKPHEIFFWNCYAPQITHLHLKGCGLEKYEEVKTIQWILLKCSNLVELRIDSYRSVWNGLYEDSFLNYLNGRVQKVALKLERLHLNHLDFLNGEGIFQSASNLKALTGNSTTLLMGEPLTGGSFPKLRKLDFLLLYPLNYLWFIQHVKKYGGNLKDLFVKSNEEGLFEDVLYMALGRCVNLEMLKLHFEVPRGYVFDFEYYTALNSVKFFNLKSFRFEIFAEGDVLLDHVVKFDFIVLKGMPNLEKLYLSIVGDIKGFKSKPGVANWMVTGASPERQRCGFLCKNLKRFTLEGFWPLKREDLLVFKGWFPCLEYFRGPFTPESFKDVFTFWGETIRTIVVGYQIAWVESEWKKRA